MSLAAITSPLRYDRHDVKQKGVEFTIKEGKRLGYVAFNHLMA